MAKIGPYNYFTAIFLLSVILFLPSISATDFGYNYLPSPSTQNINQTVVNNTYVNQTANLTGYALLNGSNFTGTVSFRGTVNQTAMNISRLDVGVESGTPRQIFEQQGYTPWQVDTLNGAFRWFQPGLVFFSITPDATPSNGATSYFNGLYPISLDTVNGVLFSNRDLWIVRNANINGKSQIGYSGTTEQRGYAVLDLNTTGSKGLSLMDSTNGGLLLGYTGAKIQGRTTANGNTQTLELQPSGGNLTIGTTTTIDSTGKATFASNVTTPNLNATSSVAIGAWTISSNATNVLIFS